MIPPLIVEECLARDIQLIAITDHNAGANIAAVQRAALGCDLAVLPGMELQTIEEVHLLCLFETLAQFEIWQAVVDRCLPNQENNIEYFGEQFVVDHEGEFIRREPRLLLNSTSLTIDEAYRQVNALGGLVIPAHVDRKAFGLFANLGFISPDWPVEALEISRHLKPTDAALHYPQLAGRVLLSGGDAHRLDELRGANLFHLAAPTLAEIRLALKGLEGRSLRLLSQTVP